MAQPFAMVVLGLILTLLPLAAVLLTFVELPS